MCRGGKDGVVRRCKSSAHKQANESFRKACYYRARKEGLDREQWIAKNPGAHAILMKERDAKLSNAVLAPYSAEQKHFNKSFLGDGEVRPTLFPEDPDEHHAQAAEEMGGMELAREESDAIYNYTSYLHEDVNKILRGREAIAFAPEDLDDYKKSRFSSAGEINETIAAMDRVLSHRHGEQRIVYRGVGQHAFGNILDARKAYPKDRDDLTAAKDLLEHYRAGSEVVFDSYSSTTQDPGFAATWTDSGNVHLVYEIRTNAGVDVVHLADEIEEREVILPREMKFKVENAYSTHDYSYHSFGQVETDHKNIVVVQLVEVDQHGHETHTMEPFMPDAYDATDYLVKFPPEELEDDDIDEYY